MHNSSADANDVITVDYPGADAVDLIFQTLLVSQVNKSCSRVPWIVMVSEDVFVNVFRLKRLVTMPKKDSYSHSPSFIEVQKPLHLHILKNVNLKQKKGD